MARTLCCLTLALVLGFALVSEAAVNSFLALGKGASEGPDQPIQITAGKFSANYGEGWAEAVYGGSVRVKQGDVTMTCERLIVTYEFQGAKPGQDKQNARLAREAQKNLQNMRSITAIGNVKIVQGDRIAMAGKAVFENNKRTIELTDNPVLWQGADRLHGQRIVFHIDEHRADVNEGVSVTISSGRVSREPTK